MASKRWQEQLIEEVSFSFKTKLERGGEGGRGGIFSVFAEVARGQLPQPVMMFLPKGCGRDAERN